MSGNAVDPGRIRTLTFDCYGTLVDWESGILRALRPVLAAHAVARADDELLAGFAAHESRIQEERFRPYADVLRRVVDALGAELGFEPTPEERDALRASLPHWPVFEDTPAALRSLGERYRLVVVSNVDDDLFARTEETLGVRMDDVVTAEQVGSYKPAPGHFREAIRRSGGDPDRILHVAQSLYHDIRPARALGLSTVWVNRRAGRPGSGATPEAAARPDREVPDLASLVALLEGGTTPG